MVRRRRVCTRSSSLNARAQERYAPACPQSPSIACGRRGGWIKARLGGGYDEFVPELFGLHTADGARIYVSDGGHYDNLGLTALLQARCREVWCIDSQADRSGRGGVLRKVIAHVRDELGVQIDLDVERFTATDGIAPSSHALGRIRYPNGDSGRLIVIKLAVTAESPIDLRQYQTTDRRFPHHPTWLQVYGHARLDAYRRLGYANAQVAAKAYANGQPPAE